MELELLEPVVMVPAGDYRTELTCSVQATAVHL